MNAEIIDNILSQAKIDKNGRIMNKGRLNDMLHSEHLKAVKNCSISIVSHCASQIPTNWVDPLLTGKEKALTGEAGQWGCPDIESLLLAIKKKIEHCG